MDGDALSSGASLRVRLKGYILQVQDLEVGLVWALGLGASKYGILVWGLEARELLLEV